MRHRKTDILTHRIILNVRINNMSWKHGYETLFDGADGDDKHFCDIIPTLDHKPFKDLLQEILDIVNSAQIPLATWAKYKMELLRSQKEWGCDLFVWTIRLGESIKKIDLRWDLLGEDASRYFTVIMAFENFWGCGLPEGYTQLPSVWGIIPFQEDLDVEDLDMIHTL